MGAKKAAKGLNKAGIRLLADDLVAHQKRYDQDIFGDIEECQTVACLAGFCYLREIGARKFNSAIKDHEFDLPDACVLSGVNQLGLGVSDPVLFSSIEYWPRDLQYEYWSNGPRSRVIAALKALQRLRPNGSIDPNPKGVHTRLPQLKALLDKTKK